MKILHVIAVSTMALALVGCDKTPATPPEPQATSEDPAPATPAPVESAPAPASATAALATKKVGENQVDVTQAKVVGNILNVELQLSNPSESGAIAEWVEAKDFYYIDDQSAKKVGLLTDDSGAPVANPLAPNGKDIELNAGKSAKIVSLKFPAPAGESISLNIPKLGSFDGLKVTR